MAWRSVERSWDRGTVTVGYYAANASSDDLWTLGNQRYEVIEAEERYGDFVLYDPPFKPATWALWLAPAGFVLISAFVLLRVLRQPPAEPLSVSETERLRVILDDD